jgi:plasmid stabilization system protein ParE
MTDRYRVDLSVDARDDLRRLYEFLLLRELERQAPDLNVADRALAAIGSAIATLERLPFGFRRAGGSPFLREIVIPFGGFGYVALYEIVDDRTVVVVAIRHQREEDFR